MGKAIAILTVVVACSITFVLVQLALRRPADAAMPAPGPAPLLETRPDGSVYAVSLRIQRLEERLIEEEERSGRLVGQVETLRRERERLGEQVTRLQLELAQIRLRLTTIPQAGPNPADEDTPAPPAAEQPSGPPPPGDG